MQILVLPCKHQIGIVKLHNKTKTGMTMQGEVMGNIFPGLSLEGIQHTAGRGRELHGKCVLNLVQQRCSQ